MCLRIGVTVQGGVIGLHLGDWGWSCSICSGVRCGVLGFLRVWLGYVVECSSIMRGMDRWYHCVYCKGGILL